MRANSKKLVRKYSLKIYRSPRLLHYPIPDVPETAKVEKEVPTQKKYNINIIKPEQNKRQGNITSNGQQQTKVDSSEALNKRNISTEEKAVIKIPISTKNTKKLNNTGEIAIKSLNKNNSGTKIISTVKESQIQNKYLSTNTNNQPLFYSNIDLSNQNKNINESVYINRRQINNDIDNKKQYRSNSQAKPQITKDVPQIKSQNRKVTQQQNATLNLKQTKSQTNLNISNNSIIKIRTNNGQKKNDIRIPRPNERKNRTNVQENSKDNRRQNTVFISSNTSLLNSKPYQDKDINKTINTSYIKTNNYRQMTQKINMPNAQNKNYKTEYKSSMQSQQINNGKNIKNNNQTYYNSQTSKRQDKSYNNAKKASMYIPDNRNGKEYNMKTKDSKPQVNYDKNKNHNIYESRNVNKENYDKNRDGYSYVVNFNNVNSSFTRNKSIDASKNKRRNIVNS